MLVGASAALPCFLLPLIIPGKVGAGSRACCSKAAQTIAGCTTATLREMGGGGGEGGRGRGHEQFTRPPLAILRMPPSTSSTSSPDMRPTPGAYDTSLRQLSLLAMYTHASPYSCCCCFPTAACASASYESAPLHCLRVQADKGKPLYQRYWVKVGGWVLKQPTEAEPSNAVHQQASPQPPAMCTTHAWCLSGAPD